jgi:hypothetical protein
VAASRGKRFSGMPPTQFDGAKFALANIFKLPAQSMSMTVIRWASIMCSFFSEAWSGMKKQDVQFLFLRVRIPKLEYPTMLDAVAFLAIFLVTVVCMFGMLQHARGLCAIALEMQS